VGRVIPFNLGKFGMILRESQSMHMEEEYSITTEPIIGSERLKEKKHG
jgi:hypothetical protein